MSNYKECDTILLEFGKRIISFTRPDTLADLKDVCQRQLNLGRCGHGQMTITYHSEDHGPVQLADDATVRALWRWTKLSLAVVRFQGTALTCLQDARADTARVVRMMRSQDAVNATAVILHHRDRSIAVDAPNSIKDCLAAAYEHFGIDPSPDNTRVIWRSANDGLVEVLHDSFFAGMGQLWALHFAVRDLPRYRRRTADQGSLIEALLTPVRGAPHSCDLSPCMSRRKHSPSAELPAISTRLAPRPPRRFWATVTTTRSSAFLTALYRPSRRTTG